MQRKIQEFMPLIGLLLAFGVSGVVRAEPSDTVTPAAAAPAAIAPSAHRTPKMVAGSKAAVYWARTSSSRSSPLRKSA